MLSLILSALTRCLRPNRWVAIAAVILLLLNCSLFSPIAIAAEATAEPTPNPVTAAPLNGYFAQITRLREDAFRATNEGDFATAETLWTKLLDQLPDNPAIWSNRGNSRVS